MSILAHDVKVESKNECKFIFENISLARQVLCKWPPCKTPKYYLNRSCSQMVKALHYENNNTLTLSI